MATGRIKQISSRPAQFDWRTDASKSCPNRPVLAACRKGTWIKSKTALSLVVVAVKGDVSTGWVHPAHGLDIPPMLCAMVQFMRTCWSDRAASCTSKSKPRFSPVSLQREFWHVPERSSWTVLDHHAKTLWQISRREWYHHTPPRKLT